MQVDQAQTKDERDRIAEMLLYSFFIHPYISEACEKRNKECFMKLDNI